MFNTSHTTPLPEPARTVVYNESKGYSFDAYTADQMTQHAAACVAAERLRIARALALMHAESASSHNYYGHLCMLMKEGKL